MTRTSVFRERTQKKSFFPFSTKRYMNPKALHHIVRSRTLKIVSNQQLLMIYVDATLRILRGRGAFCKAHWVVQRSAIARSALRRWNPCSRVLKNVKNSALYYLLLMCEHMTYLLEAKWNQCNFLKTIFLRSSTPKKLLFLRATASLNCSFLKIDVSS